jgi:hypothetical protein
MGGELMRRPVTFVKVETARFLLRVYKVPFDGRALWVTQLAEALAEGLRGEHPFADELLSEVEEFRERDTKRKKAYSKDSVESKDSVDSSHIHTNTTDIQTDNKNNKGTSRPRFAAPTLDQVSEYCLERKNQVQPQAFIDFYASKGWVVGRSPMKDWKAAVRTWEKNNFGKGTTNAKPYRSRIDGINENARHLDRLLGTQEEPGRSAAQTNGPISQPTRTGT